MDGRLPPYQDFNFPDTMHELSDSGKFEYTITIEDSEYSETGPSQYTENDSLLFKGDSQSNLLSFPTGGFSSASPMVDTLGGLHLDTHNLSPYAPPLVGQYNTSPHDERVFLQPPTSPWYPSSPPTAYISPGPFSAPLEGASMVFSDSAGSGSENFGRGRSRSLSSGSPYHCAWHTRSSSTSSYTRPIGHGSGKNRESSVVSDNSSLEHINPQVLSSPTYPTPNPSSLSSTLYSSRNGSVSSLCLSDSACGDERVKYRTNVATEKTQAASEKRRKKEPKFFCQEPGCNQGFTAKHNLINHENSHRGIRDFVCNHCNDGFITRSVMMRHVKKCPAKKAKKNESK